MTGSRSIVSALHGRTDLSDNTDASFFFPLLAGKQSLPRIIAEFAAIRLFGK